MIHGNLPNHFLSAFRWAALIAGTTVGSMYLSAQETSAEPPAGQAIAQEQCLQCHADDNPRYPDHSLEWILRRDYSNKGWTAVVDRMEKTALADEYISERWSSDDKTALVAYLTQASTDHRQQHPPSAETIVRDQCLVCHRVQDPDYPDHNLGWIYRKRYTKEGWTEVVDRMEKIALNAHRISEPWKPEIKSAMVDHLVEQTSVQRTDRDRLGMMHYSAVHFPIAIVFVLFLFEGIGLLAGWPMRRDLLHALTWLGAISAGVAVGLGLVLAQGYTSLGEDLLDHRTAGFAALAALLLGVAAREIALRTGSAAPRWAYRLSLLLAMAASGAAGHLGGKLVHGEFLPPWITG